MKVLVCIYLLLVVYPPKKGKDHNFKIRFGCYANNWWLQRNDDKNIDRVGTRIILIIWYIQIYKVQLVLAKTIRIKKGFASNRLRKLLKKSLYRRDGELGICWGYLNAKRRRKSKKVLHSNWTNNFNHWLKAKN